MPLSADKQLIVVPMSRTLAGVLRKLATEQETSMSALVRRLIRQEALKESEEQD
jgi:hypothetical protein